MFWKEPIARFDLIERERRISVENKFNHPTPIGDLDFANKFGTKRSSMKPEGCELEFFYRQPLLAELTSFNHPFASFSLEIVTHE